MTEHTYVPRHPCCFMFASQIRCCTMAGIFSPWTARSLSTLIALSPRGRPLFTVVRMWSLSSSPYSSWWWSSSHYRQLWQSTVHQKCVSYKQAQEKEQMQSLDLDLRLRTWLDGASCPVLLVITILTIIIIIIGWTMPHAWFHWWFKNTLLSISPKGSFLNKPKVNNHHSTIPHLRPTHPSVHGGCNSEHALHHPIWLEAPRLLYNTDSLGNDHLKHENDHQYGCTGGSHVWEIKGGLGLG